MTGCECFQDVGEKHFKLWIDLKLAEDRGLCDHGGSNYRQTLHNINLDGLNCTDAASNYHDEDKKNPLSYCFRLFLIDF